VANVQRELSRGKRREPSMARASFERKGGGSLFGSARDLMYHTQNELHISHKRWLGRSNFIE